MEADSDSRTGTVTEPTHTPTTGAWFNALPWYKQAYFSLFFFGGQGCFAAWVLDWLGIV